MQAWNYMDATEAIASVGLVLALMSLQNVPVYTKRLPMEAPFDNENGLALSKMKFQAYE